MSLAHQHATGRADEFRIPMRGYEFTDGDTLKLDCGVPNPHEGL